MPLVTSRADEGRRPRMTVGDGDRTGAVAWRGRKLYNAAVRIA